MEKGQRSGSKGLLIGYGRCQAVDPVFQAKMLDMLKQTGRRVEVMFHLPRTYLAPVLQEGSYF